MDRMNCRDLRTATALLAAAVFIALSPDAYLPMLVRAFIEPLSAAFALVALFFLLRRKWLQLPSALAGCAMLLVQVPPAASEPPEPAEGPLLRLLHMNVLQPNTSYKESIGMALAGQADVISMQEVGREWATALGQGLRNEYPYQHVEPRSDCYGIALFSKRPFTSVRTMTMQGTPFIEAWMDVEGTPVRLMAVHATSPTSYAHFRQRNAQLAQLGDHLAPCDTATVLLGDLNTVPWDAAFRRLTARTGLVSTAKSTLRTWPSFGPFALIPLDHVLVSSDVQAVSLRSVQIPGSDHRGLHAELHLKTHAN